MTVKKIKTPEPEIVKDDVRTLLLYGGDGEFKVDIPKTARITFGPAVPFHNKSRRFDGGQNTYAIRIYADKGNDRLLLQLGEIVSIRIFPDWRLDLLQMILTN